MKLIIVGFIAVFFIGAFAGMMLMAMLQINKDREDDTE